MSKRGLIWFFISIFFLLLNSSIFSENLRVFGKNQLSYWRWEKNSKYFCEDKLTLYSTYGNFRGNLEWYIYEPSDVISSYRKEGIRKRFIEYKDNEWALKVGNFSKSLGKGLILNQTLDEAGNIERDIDGFFIHYFDELFNIGLFSGKPENLLFSNGIYSTPNDTNDLLQGGNLSSDIIPLSSINLNLVRLSSQNPGSESPRKTYLYSFDISTLKSPFIISLEIAKRDGWSEIQYTESEGQGIFGSFTFFIPEFAVNFEYLYYDSLGYGGSIYRYNAPPTGNLYGYSINRGSDERGWMFDITSNPFDNWYIELNKSLLSTISSDSIGFEELYAEIKGDIIKRGPGVLIAIKNLKYKRPEPLIKTKTEWIPEISVMSSFGPISAKAAAKTRIVEIDTTIDKVSFNDNSFALDIGIFSFLSLSGRWEIRNKEVLIESEGKEWKVLEARWDISDSHTMNLMFGSEKGGLVCSGGVCRFEEPFTGVKINLFSRF